MGEKGEITPKPQDYDSSSPKDPLEHDSLETMPHGGGSGGGGGGHLHRRHHHHPHDSSLIVATPFISTPLYLPTGTTTAPFEAVNPKRTRYTAGQWKLLPSPSSSQPPGAILGSDSSPSPSQRPTGAAAASSSDTTSSPCHSPLPSTARNKGGGGGGGGEGESQNQNQPQFRKGKYVSPVWKPNEMLWLARAWRLQYQGTKTTIKF